jgi:hypothetical protein
VRQRELMGNISGDPMRAVRIVVAEHSTDV